MFYVPLATKGKFYEVGVNTNQSSSNSHTNGNPLTFDASRKGDYVYRISDLVFNSSCLPLNLKLIFAPPFVDVPGKASIIILFIQESTQ